MARYLFFHSEHPLHVHGVNGGAEVATIALATQLKRDGHEVVVCGRLPEGDSILNDVPYWDFTDEYRITECFDRFERLSIGEPFHLISTNRVLPLIIGRNYESVVSRIFLSHCGTISTSGVSGIILSASVDRILCVSNAQVERLLAEGCDPSKISVIGNGVDLEMFKPTPGLMRAPYSLVFVGALVYDKGCHLLIEAFVKLKQRIPQLTLDVYGSGALWGRDEYLDTASLAGNIPGLVFHGNQPRQVIAAALRKTKICVIPSVWFDCFPLTALEAQASGCPVVSFNVGGIPETYLDGITGVKVSEISVDALAEALYGMLEDRSALNLMSEQARIHVELKHSWATITQRIAEVCREEEQRRQQDGKAACVTRILSDMQMEEKVQELLSSGQRKEARDLARQSVKLKLETLGVQ